MDVVVLVDCHDETLLIAEWQDLKGSRRRRFPRARPWQDHVADVADPGIAIKIAEFPELRCRIVEHVVHDIDLARRRRSNVGVAVPVMREQVAVQGHPAAHAGRSVVSAQQGALRMPAAGMVGLVERKRSDAARDSDVFAGQVFGSEAQILVRGELRGDPVDVDVRTAFDGQAIHVRGRFVAGTGTKLEVTHQNIVRFEYHQRRVATVPQFDLHAFTGRGLTRKIGVRRYPYLAVDDDRARYVEDTDAPLPVVFGTIAQAAGPFVLQGGDVNYFSAAPTGCVLSVSHRARKRDLRIVAVACHSVLGGHGVAACHAGIGRQHDTRRQGGTLQ